MQLVPVRLPASSESNRAALQALAGRLVSAALFDQEISFAQSAAEFLTLVRIGGGAIHMKLSHLVLTVIEYQDHPDQCHWILLEATGHAVDQLREFAAPEDAYGKAQGAFDAGALRWLAEMSREDEDADPVGDGGTEPE